MLFAYYTRHRMKTLAIFMATYVLIVAVLAAVFPGQGASYSETFVKWLVGIPIVLATWFVLELAATKLLDLPFWRKMPGIARVALLVLIIVLVIVAVVVAVKLITGQDAL